MPVYEFECIEHGKQMVYRHSCESMLSAPCPVCGKEAERLWTSTGGPPLFTPYYTDAIDGKRQTFIGSKEEEKAFEKKHGIQRIK